MSSAFDGGCLCGAVRFRVTGVPLVLSRCHCRSCRLAVGSAGVAWTMIKRSDFTLLQGSLTYYRSSPGIVRTFCPICGTSVSYEPDDNPENIEITTSIFDDPAPFAPTREVWLDHHITWEPLDPSLKHFPKDSFLTEDIT